MQGSMMTARLQHGTVVTFWQLLANWASPLVGSKIARREHATNVFNNRFMTSLLVECAKSQ
jgi:hypothetical protein